MKFLNKGALWRFPLVATCAIAILVVALAQTDTRATSRSGGLSLVPCGPTGLPTNDDFCMYLNGYHWMHLDKKERAMFLSGYGQGVHFALMKVQTTTNLPGGFRQFLSRLVPKADPDEQGASLEEFYATPENLGLPIQWALQMVAAKAAGVDAGEIRRQTEEFRRLVVQGPAQGSPH